MSQSEYNIQCQKNEIAICTIEEALESLQNIKRNGGYWRGDTSLDESIKQLELEL